MYPGCEYCVAGFEIVGWFQDLFAGVTHDACGGVPAEPLEGTCSVP